MASIFKIGIAISQNTKCDNLVGFSKSGHIYVAIRNILPNKHKKQEFYNNNRSLMLVIRLLIWQDVYNHNQDNFVYA